MRNIFLISLYLISNIVFASDTYVRGYTRKDGTYVDGYHRTSQDGTVNNNYGTQGNKNPYTGKKGHKAKDPNQGTGTYNLGNGEGEE